MGEGNETGKRLGVIIGVYLCVKQIINIIFGGGIGVTDILLILLGAAQIFCSIKGIKYSHYIVGIIIGVLGIFGVIRNIAHPIHNLLYLIEGVIDVFAAFLLLANRDIKEQCQQTRL